MHNFPVNGVPNLSLQIRNFVVYSEYRGSRRVQIESKEVVVLCPNGAMMRTSRNVRRKNMEEKNEIFQAI